LKSETEKPIRFAVRSLGWVEIAEEDLTPERSSKAVNKCILDLSFGKNDLLDVVGRWGDVSFAHSKVLQFFLSLYETAFLLSAHNGDDFVLGQRLVLGFG
jgi:hypothetical protein